MGMPSRELAQEPKRITAGNSDPLINSTGIVKSTQTHYSTVLNISKLSLMFYAAIVAE
jgi:hypothetical protein